MLLNYLRVALRSIRRQPGASSIKLLSLVIGLACSMIVILHVQYATSFDKHYPNWQNTYRLTGAFDTDHRMFTATTPDPWGPQLKVDHPEIELMGRVRAASAMFSANSSTGGETVSNHYFWAEPDIISIFALDFVSGDASTALRSPYEIVLDETTAAKLLPGQDALGKSLTVDEQFDVKVVGVYRDMPKNSHLRMPLLMSDKTGKAIDGDGVMYSKYWFSFRGTLTYLTLPNKQAAAAIEADLPAFIRRNLPNGVREFATKSNLAVGLESIGDIYLSPIAGFGGTNNRAKILVGLTVFAALILLTACINFANLSVSQVQQRAKEVGIRKTLGAQRGQIVLQFLMESLLLTFVALLVAIPIVFLVLPLYASMTHTDFSVASAAATGSIVTLPIFVLATGLVVGLVPALALGGLPPTAALRNSKNARGSRGILRRLVTVFQFAISTSLIVLAVAISLQIEHLNASDIGFDKSNLLVVKSTYNRKAPDQFDYAALINDLKQDPAVEAVSKSMMGMPGSYLNPWSKPSLPEGETVSVHHIVVDERYLRVMKMRLIAGRDFSAERETDFVLDRVPPEKYVPDTIIRAAILTRQGAISFGFRSPKDALGQLITLAAEEFEVVGVVDNFQLSGGMENSLDSIQVLRATHEPSHTLILRISPNGRARALAHIDKVWKKHRPTVPIDRSFYEDAFKNEVSKETEGIQKAAAFASLIAVLLSMFGLYALAFYAAQRRTKEVGIRKVLGATSQGIVARLTFDFVKPVAVGCILSWGAAHWSVAVFLGEFSSQVEIPLSIYALITLGTLFVAVAAVLLRSLRAATADPVQSLRYE